MESLGVEQDFVKGYSEWLRTSTRQARLGEYTEITTPFLDHHNDCLQYYIKRHEKGYSLTDDSYVISDLEMCGCDVRSAKRAELIASIAASLGVSIHNNEITIEASFSDISEKQHMLVQAMLKISDMVLTTRSRVKSLFLEDVSKFLSDNDVRYSPSIVVRGESGLAHNYDFVIPRSKIMPERLVSTINVPDRQSIQLTMFAWKDIRATRESTAYAILNDSKKRVSSELLNASKRYGITPVLWSEKDEYIKELVS